MDRDRVIQALHQALDQAPRNALPAPEQTSKLQPEDAEALFIHRISRQVEAVLGRAEPFQRGGFFIQEDKGYTGFHANEASIALCRRVLRGEAPEEAVVWLEKILATKRATGIGVLALYGVQVTTRVDIGQGVTLAPFLSLPDSSTKRWLSQWRDPTTFPGFLASPFSTPPKAALTCAHTISPLLHPVDEGHPPEQAEPFRIQSLLDDARLALTLVGPSCPMSAGYWFQFDDPDLRDAHAYSGVSTSYQEVLPFGFPSHAHLDEAESKRIVSAFIALRDPLRATLRLALQRFNQALRRPLQGDRTLDLAIALESLLVDDPGEHTYKIGLRAALLLKGPLERRREVRAVVSGLYALRSALIHNGTLPSEIKVATQGKRSSAEVVQQPSEICVSPNTRTRPLRNA